MPAAARSTANYTAVSTGATGHAEAVEITYDPKRISYGKLLQIFFSVAHDPTQLNRQGPDSGTQYRSAIFTVNDEQKKVAEAYIAQLNAAKVYKKPIVTKIGPLEGFYAAEDYHQDYLTLHPNQPYIVVQRSAEDREPEEDLRAGLSREADAGEQSPRPPTERPRSQHGGSMSDTTTKPGKIDKSEAEWRQELTPMQYAVLREKATERPFSRRIRAREGQGHLCLRRLRPDAVRVRRQVRFRLRLAELHRAGGGRPCRRGARRQPRHGPHRGAVRALQRPSRPRVSGRPGSDRPALLHQFGGAEAAEEVVRQTIVIATRSARQSSQRRARRWIASLRSQ